jgi:aspartate racemase
MTVGGKQFVAAGYHEPLSWERLLKTGMKTIGLLGGMSWQSTVGYYRAINEGIKNTLGGLHSAKIALYSVDFDPIAQMQNTGDWDEMARVLSEAAQSVEAAGADFLLLCTNTMHKVAPQIEKSINIPLLHIADATAEALVQEGIKTVGLLGTAFTMEQDFYKGRLSKNYGLKVLVPESEDRQTVHDVIFQELCLGKIEARSKTEYLRIIDSLAKQGAEAVILGCTEIGLLVNQDDTKVKLLDTTAVHAAKAVTYALS